MKTIHMKNRILIVAVALGGLFSNCNAQSGFTINGTADAAASGMAYLVSFEPEKRDTIAAAAIVGGAFTLSGRTDSLQMVGLFIKVDGEEISRTVQPIFLENATFAVHVGPLFGPLAPPTSSGPNVAGSANSMQGGGPVQQLYNHFYNPSQERMYQKEILTSSLRGVISRDSLIRMLKSQETAEDWSRREEEIINANLNSLVVAYVLTVKYWHADVATQMQQFARLGPDAQASKSGQLFAGRIEQSKRRISATAVGQKAIDFTLATPTGEPLSLHALPAKFKLVDFWASWCGACRMENPRVKDIYAKYHSKGLEVLGVSLDTNKDKWLQAIEEDGLPWPHVIDQKSVVSTLYGIAYIPFTMLLDENNKIIATNFHGDALEAKIAELLD
jgi:peroxiredoxin